MTMPMRSAIVTVMDGKSGSGDDDGHEDADTDGDGNGAYHEWEGWQ